MGNALPRYNTTTQRLQVGQGHQQVRWAGVGQQEARVFGLLIDDRELRLRFGDAIMRVHRSQGISSAAGRMMIDALMVAGRHVPHQLINLAHGGQVRTVTTVSLWSDLIPTNEVQQVLQVAVEMGVNTEEIQQVWVDIMAAHAAPDGPQRVALIDYGLDAAELMFREGLRRIQAIRAADDADDADDSDDNNNAEQAEVPPPGV